MMKLQDILFIAVAIVILVARRPQLFVWAGLGSLALAIPLFSFWVFFTAQRLTMYAAAFFILFLGFSYRDWMTKKEMKS